MGYGKLQPHKASLMFLCGFCHLEASFIISVGEDVELVHNSIAQAVKAGWLELANMAWCGKCDPRKKTHVVDIRE